MNLRYCIDKCPIGIRTKEEFLNKNDSVYDAAMDFQRFTEKCFETCIYKNKHIDEEKK